MKVLVIGGNRFFGKRLVQNLLDKNVEISVLNRGQLKDPFGDKVHRITCDREDSAALEKSIQGQSWDVVVDQVAFEAKVARESCRLFEGKTQRYIFTSSQSVYTPGVNLREEDFDAAAYDWSQEKARDEDYGEAKRQTEATFIQLAPFDNSGCALSFCDWKG